MAKGTMTHDEAAKVLMRQLGATCPVCGYPIHSTDDPGTYEYARTKRKSDIFIHTKCVKDW